MNEFFSRIKFVKFIDILSIFPLIVGLVIGKLFKINHPHIWLICERKAEARDNGYWFFRYMRKYHKEIECIYAISKKSKDYNKVKKLGKVIEFGKLQHWIYYFAAEKNISSQKEGKPNAALCYIIEVYLGMRKNRIYLKHGIIKDDQKWIYYKNSKINLICCASERECNFIRDKFGYPRSNVQVLGLCRFDNLYRKSKIKKQILVMPTWREWLGRLSSDIYNFENTNIIYKSEYFLTWNEFLCCKELENILYEFNYSLLFYPHPSMQKYIKYFKKSKSSMIEIASENDYDIQKILIESALLITDYSSVYFDFAYMKKPVIYYQFDYNKYRIGQYQEGYYSYIFDGFGPIVYDKDKLISEINEILKRKCKNEDLYNERIDKFFKYKDNSNCMRTYNEILKH